MESKYKLINFGPDDVEAIRKEFNINNEERREEAFRIIEEWLLKQEHLVKKTFSNAYIENCLISSKGSIEAAKLQIDKMCTLRTLHPKYFEHTNVMDKELTATNKCYFGFSSSLTTERYRVFITKIKPDISLKFSDFEKLHALLTMIGEFLKTYDCSKGMVFLVDALEANLADIVTKFSIVEMQQFLPILTAGQGFKIKGVIFLTKSKFIDSFVKLIKPLFKEKIRNRIHTATSTEQLKEFMTVDILPKEYGGIEKPLEKLHENLLTVMSSEPVKGLLKYMNSARTDESKRQRDVFNEQYMGMAGTFRTMSLD